MLFLIITITISMSISFLCSIMEACTLSISTADIAKMSEKKPKTGKIWENFKKDIEKPISVILIINTLAHTIGAAISGAQFDKVFGSDMIAVFSLAYSFAMIQWTEILPKTLGVTYKRVIAAATAVPLKTLVIIFTPFIKLIHLLNKPFESSKSRQKSDDLIDDISVLARFASMNNKITKHQASILSGTLRLQAMCVNEIMVKKDEIKMLTTDMSLTDALIVAHIHHHTRFPLSIKERGEVIGYVNFKDIVAALQLNKENPTLIGICRPITYIEENEKLHSALTKLTKGYQHIALVQNKTGKVVGFITLEDVIEEILGEINDEYDKMPDHIFNITPKRFLIGGGTKIKTINDKVGAGIDADDSRQISEYLTTLKGEPLKNEEKVTFDKVIFTVRKTSRSQIYELILDIRE